MIDMKIYLKDPEGDKAGMETTVVNGITYYRSLAEEKKWRKAEAERLKMANRTAFRANLKVMCYSVHNLPSNTKTSV